MTDIGFTAKHEKAKEVKPAEPRTQVVRRQFNDSFNDPRGVFSWSKFVATFGQIACLYQFGKHFEVLIDHSDSLAIIVAFIIAPDLVKKLLTMKYGDKK